MSTGVITSILRCIKRKTTPMLTSNAQNMMPAKEKVISLNTKRITPTRERAMDDMSCVLTTIPWVPNVHSMQSVRSGDVFRMARMSPRDAYWYATIATAVLMPQSTETPVAHVKASCQERT